MCKVRIATTGSVMEVCAFAKPECTLARNVTLSGAHFNAVHMDNAVKTHTGCADVRKAGLESPVKDQNAPTTVTIEENALTMVCTPRTFIAIELSNSLIPF